MVASTEIDNCFFHIGGANEKLEGVPFLVGLLIWWLAVKAGR